MYLPDDYIDIIELFNKHDVKYLISGAYAMSKLGYSRSTYDIDIWVEKSKNNAIKIYNALEEFGVPFKISPDDFLEPNSVIQLGIEPCRIDILTDIDGVDFDDAWQKKEKTTFNNISSYILCLEDLILNKSSTKREKDLLDLAQLRKLAKLAK